jgi:hypothetical protein
MTIRDDNESAPVVPEALPISIFEQKRTIRKRKAPVNFRLNKILVRADSSDEVLTVVSEHLSEFNIVNIGTALYRLALVGGSQSPSSRDLVRSDQRFVALIKEIVETLEGDSERDSLQQVRCLFRVIVYVTNLGGVGAERALEYHLGGNKAGSE